MVEQRDADPRADSCPRRVVLLGASNLTRGIATIVDAAERQWGQPLDCLAALGHGRSYGTRSTVLGRTLPSILRSQLWTELAKRPAAPLAALVTDIGNDLLYEAPVEKIAGWVAECLDRLQRFQARTVMTRLPLENIAHVPEWKFRLLRRLMFPGGRLPFSTIATRAQELDARLIEIAQSRRVSLVEQSRAWYGWDPIHLHSRHWPRVWHHILTGWNDDPTDAAATNAPLSERIYLRTRTPHERWILGIRQSAPQPSAVLRSGTRVSFY